MMDTDSEHLARKAMSCEDLLRSALDSMIEVREALRHEGTPRMEAIMYELGHAEVSVERVLHLMDNKKGAP